MQMTISVWSTGNRDQLSELLLVGGYNCQDLSQSARIGSSFLLTFAHQILQVGSEV
jgi:hypothetical protein